MSSGHQIHPPVEQLDQSTHQAHDGADQQHGHSQHPGHSGHGGHTGHRGHQGDTGHAGHGGHGDHVGQFRRLFWVMLLFAVPVVGASGMFADLLGYRLPDLVWVGWISPVLGTVMYVVGGRPFLTGAISELRSRRPGMMLLIGLAITVAFVASWGASLGLLDHQLDFWWELALLIVIMLLGHWIEMRSLARTTSALDSLAALLPDEAERVRAGADGRERIDTVGPDDLEVDDLVIIRPGGAVPADGRIVDGAAELDESMITGESRTVRREVGDPVVAGTVATDSGLRIKITATGEETTLAGIRRLVSDAQNSSSRAQRLADRAAGWLFWFALGAGVITAIVWTVIGLPDEAVIRTITVLVIACPHALGLAIPLVVSIATEQAARAGVLIKDRLALESMRRVDTVLFDKTGTLTKGEPAVTAIATVEGVTENELLKIAAAVESASEHPLARAIVRTAQDRGLELPAVRDFTSAPAVGVDASVEGRRIRVGGPRLLEQVAADELAPAADWHDRGDTVLHVLRDDRVVGAIGMADEIRTESRQAIAALGGQGVQVVMITGDAEPVARSVAGELGIERFYAGVRPEDKSGTVADLQREGRTVAMVGDGVNDAPALARADVGIAIGAGTDVAIASAGVILAGSDPRTVLSVIRLSRASYRKMKQNLWWAAGYNLISVPLAAGVLAPIGFVLPMSVGAILMSLSTVIVALNAQLLRRLTLLTRSGRVPLPRA
ncbi:heavy metal translocating P-type ATPase [Microlunatus elymi]|uniref:Heavy metal translocating P-type ATPase n=1 Tax=Microlunatus elymi TaxID=2596828 RepID=A0A516Q1Q6_9ACTN|nr:heavy metal translocating P-type ATPase [Microlunatus elymi]QDP97353.1 heavy metal translocating P-type ATPase [Microlunatus elymi]